MAEAKDEIIVFVTASSEEEAVKIGRKLVEVGLAACVNVFPRVRSIFRWEGAVSDEQESMMIVKSRASLFDELVTMVKGLHSYSVPEIIALPIQQGSADYLKWIGDVTGKPKK